jgi:hypothetical protein
MRKALVLVCLLLLGGIVLGATVFRAPVVWAAQQVDANIIGPLDNGNVRVHEEGTAQVQEKRDPFQRTVLTDDWGGNTFRNFTVAIPTGKVLIVQTVSVSAVVEAGQAVRANVTAQGVGGLSNHPIPLDREGSFSGRDLYVGTESISAYATGSFGLLASVVRNSASGSGGRVQFSVSGYLVDA